MTQAPLLNSSSATGGSIFTSRQLTQVMMLFAVGISAGLYWYGSRWLAVPGEPRFQGSLLQPPVSVGGMLLALGGLVIAAIICDFLVGSRWFLAGLLAATAGLTALAIRGGTMQAVLLRADAPSAGRTVFTQLLTEHVILMLAIGGLWFWLWGKRASDRKDLFAADGDAEDPGRSTGPALLAQVGTMVIIILIFLAATPVKKQVLVGVFLAGLAGTAIAETFFASRDTGRFYWLGPLIVGALGYVAGFMQPAGIEIGFLSGPLGALSRPLPLDYASIACAGALLGYWMYMPEAQGLDSLVSGSDPSPVKI